MSMAHMAVKNKQTNKQTNKHGYPMEGRQKLMHTPVHTYTHSFPYLLGFVHTINENGGKKIDYADSGDNDVGDEHPRRVPIFLFSASVVWISRKGTEGAPHLP